MAGFCEDFDESGDAGAFGAATEVGIGALVGVQSVVSSSPPNAVKAVTMQVPDGGVAQAFLSRSIGPGTTYTIAFDAFLTPPPAYDGDDVLGGLWFAAEYLTLRVEPGESPGTLTVNVAERTNTEYTDHTRYSVTAGQWSRLSLTIEPAAGGFADSLSINDVIVEPSTMLAPSFDNVAGPTAMIGWGFVGSPDGLTTYVDNVVVLWE